VPASVSGLPAGPLSTNSSELVGIRGCAKRLMTLISVPYYVCKSFSLKGLQKDLTGFLGMLWWELGGGGSAGYVPTARTFPTGT